MQKAQSNEMSSVSSDDDDERSYNDVFSTDSYNNYADDSEEERDAEDELAERQRTMDRHLFEAVTLNDAAAVQQALGNGANVNCINEASCTTPLMEACDRGNDAIVRILLDEGANVQWRNDGDLSAIENACLGGNLSTVEIMLNHDSDLLENADKGGLTPIMVAINCREFDVVNLLLDRGANALVIDEDGRTTLMLACRRWANLQIVRRLLDAGVDVGTHCKGKSTALHHAALHCTTAVVRELVVEHNANIFAVDKNGKTPFDLVLPSDATGGTYAFFIECYCNKLNHKHDRLALHAVLKQAEYSFVEDYEFHPPLNPLQIRLQLGKLTLQHFRTLLSTLGTELVRTRNDSGKLPIHIAGRKKAPVEVLTLILEHDAATLHIADYSGALPLHVSCRGAVDYSSVRFLVEQGGVGTLAARTRSGALPLHNFCGSANPSLRTVQYLIQSFPGSVAVQTNSGEYPFMIAACPLSTASLSVIYELVRANPGLAVPN